MAWRVEEIEGPPRSALIELEGVVDSTNVDRFFSFINSVFKRDIVRMVLDLSGTSYLSSGGLSVIIDAYNKARGEGGKLVIAGASEMIRDLFEAVQFEKILEFYATVEEALDNL